MIFDLRVVYFQCVLTVFTTVCQDNSGQFQNVNKGGRLFCSGKNKIKIVKATLALSTPNTCPLHFKDKSTIPVCFNLVDTDVTRLLGKM